eukprot:CAMPEP_0178926072 /NCGR_PEP_ID=MMETSP0786-20121207/18298_1 /TAXON_ID=186022 /ORGANISM="Thalassionema frauenfeldii, Strain CCMP 1798" /LENGTH=363 /DNA_ID=CAMNT_0020601091 /DNA_START=107 /DNA_END=1198 /DNA_ORIENTATION=-
MLIHSAPGELDNGDEKKEPTEPTEQLNNFEAVCSKSGAYQRNAAKHRHHIDSDTDFPIEAERYHLHIALACPWANGVLQLVYLKGLEDIISHSVVHPTWGKTSPDPNDDHYGWVYRKPTDEPVANPYGHGSFPCDDSLILPAYDTGLKSVRQVFNECGDQTGPYTTPCLYDKVAKRIVSNESMDILRLINNEFNALAKHPDFTLYPQDEKLKEELEVLNQDVIYPKINNGVYRSGFAKSQDAYMEAVTDVFDGLELVEKKLTDQRFLGGDKFTWLDLRLFNTLIRFDPVYVTYFKTNKKRIADYPALLGFCRDVYSIPEIKQTINMNHIKTHYFTSHAKLNPYGIIPIYDGPDLEAPHNREDL